MTTVASSSSSSAAAVSSYIYIVMRDFSLEGRYGVVCSEAIYSVHFDLYIYIWIHAGTLRSQLDAHCWSNLERHRAVIGYNGGVLIVRPELRL